MKKIFLIVASLVVCACASNWSPVHDQPVPIVIEDITFDAPAGWVAIKNPSNVYGRLKPSDKITKVRRALLSRDGLDLNAIEIIRFDSADAFPGFSHPSIEKSIPYEWVSMYFAEQMRRRGIHDLKISKSEPAAVFGEKGFLVQYRYHDKEGLLYEQTAYGISVNDGFFVFQFRAPALYYFERDYPVFQKLIASARKS